MYDEVRSVPFTDSDGKYAAMRNFIESTARDSGIELTKLKADVFSPSGRAAKARSALTRKCFRSLVRKANQSQQHRHQSDTRTPNHKLAQALPLGGIHLVESCSSESEYFTDAEDSEQKTCRNPHIDMASRRPHLTFRVWDHTSLCNFDGGFLASTFEGWSWAPPPIRRDDPSNAFTILAHGHLSKRGGIPVFVATTSVSLPRIVPTKSFTLLIHLQSLIQVLNIASKLENPRFAAIDLQAQCMQEEDKLHHAADVLRWLKNDCGIKLTYRYRGYGDWVRHVYLFCRIHTHID